MAVYWPSDGELDPRPWVQRAWARGIHCYLPVIVPAESTLAFFPYGPDTRLEAHRWGMMEPIQAGPPIAIEKLDVILLPLVGFSPDGHRIGRGGGYYDRTLTEHRDHPFRIGLAHQCQQVLHWQPAAWDLPCHSIVTELGIAFPEP